MRTCVFMVVMATTLARAAGPYADGWTPEGLTKAVDTCTEELVQGAWENTKREQGADPKLALSAEQRKELAPQIAAFRGLCDCTVRAAAEKYGKAAYQKKDPALDRYVEQLVTSGRCTVKAP